ncbi:YhfX family PLP-dependent enzyme [Neobacillus novalis]|uniref:YhfX family PLP-dependent enzyme n=1 Tax=Neobacillus novalis TaxID=220687 RepID=A0AA95MLQ3_9BACI|nr:YhfX family PLP-dependent enzyme [Neobacillus novalis]WHY85835.1 YhfX family PLP-dependent enzyme [Neobacillus novalis]
MFLEVTQKYNPELIEFALELHQNGSISPNTYVIDLDTIRKNSFILFSESRKQNIELFFMTKQFGRNPLIAQAIVESGIEKAVAVDPWEALSLSKNGIKIGHVGHLVQIPKKMIAQILALNPEYVTVFSYENAKNIHAVASKMNKRQKVLLRIATKDDYIYNGQEGGFTLEQINQQIEALERLTGIQIAGLTSFPCVLINGADANITPNVASMHKVKSFLEDRGYKNLELNMPSATSTETLPLLKKHGATQGEPGHALTGTTPLHAVKDLPEKPAMIYVSEVSHCYEDKAYVFGGGFYPRSRMEGALVGTNKDDLEKIPIIENDPTNIDYYGTLDTSKVHVGDTVIYAFRTQIFVTNAQVAIVENLKTSPELLGIFDSMGHLIC